MIEISESVDRCRGQPISHINNTGEIMRVEVMISEHEIGRSDTQKAKQGERKVHRCMGRRGRNVESDRKLGASSASFIGTQRFP